jgi:hypothetical protein
VPSAAAWPTCLFGCAAAPGMLRDILDAGKDVLHVPLYIAIYRLLIPGEAASSRYRSRPLDHAIRHRLRLMPSCMAKPLP